MAQHVIKLDPTKHSYKNRPLDSINYTYQDHNGEMISVNGNFVFNQDENPNQDATKGIVVFENASFSRIINDPILIKKWEGASGNNVLEILVLNELGLNI